MTYPYWVVEWSEGRLPAPLHVRGTMIAKMFDDGRIGGRRQRESEHTDLEDALWALTQHRDSVLWEVTARGRQRQRVNVEQVRRLVTRRRPVEA